MNNIADMQRLSEIQDEIVGFTWKQIGDRANKIYIQGKVTDDGSGNITFVEGNLKYAVVDGAVVGNSIVLSKDEFRENAAVVRPRIVELHDLLTGLQAKSPVRFRWSVDCESGQVESDWTYYDDLTAQEKQDDFWQHWKGDAAWKVQLEAELAGE